MIQKAEWDSIFFDFPVGKISFENPKDNFEEVISASEKYRLVYVFSDTDFKVPGLELVDKKVIYEKILTTDQNNLLEDEKDTIAFFDPKIHSYNKLLELAFLSGTYSRFKLDRNIPISKFRGMYKLWLDNSINKEIAFETLVSSTRGDVSGFVTLGNNGSHCSKIGLIAVNADYQGRNIGSKLISKCENISRDKGYSFIEVATQGDNKAACGVYEKNNFKIKSVQFIYHLWNK